MAMSSLPFTSPIGTLTFLPQRQLPYTITQQQRKGPSSKNFPLSKPANPSLVVAAEAVNMRASAWLRVTHGSFPGPRPRGLHLCYPGPAVGNNRRSGVVLTRYFREGHTTGGSDEEVAPPVPTTLEANGDSDPRVALSAGGREGATLPQSNAVPFVPSTRQRHHQHADLAAAVQGGAPAPLVPGPSRRRGLDGIVGREEAEAYAGLDEAIRRRADALRQAMFREAERRAIELHPNILVEDLAEEATVPFGAAGSLDPTLVPDGEGEAAGSPSAGAGPHSGLALESLDVETGGFTTSMPVVDPAYDDVGQAIRDRRGPRGRRRHASLLVAEMQARKAATAVDLRENILDSAPELQDTYRVFGAGHIRDITRQSTTGGTIAASDEDVQELLESGLPFGQEGTVLAEGAELPPEDASAQADILSPLAPGRGGDGADQLDAALDALEHREVLDLLESGTVYVADASANIDVDDISNVMPSPVPTVSPGSSSSSNDSSSANTSTASTHNDANVHTRNGVRTPALGTHKNATSARKCVARPLAVVGADDHARSASRRRRVTLSSSSGRGGEARHRMDTDAHIRGSYPPPFYHTSPDVPEEDLVRHQRRPRSRRGTRFDSSSSTVSSPARGTGGAATAPEADVVVAEKQQKSDDAAVAGSVDRHPADNARWVRQAPLYNTSPDVPDEELLRAAAAVDFPHQADAISHSGSTGASSAADRGAVSHDVLLSHQPQQAELGRGGRAEATAEPLMQPVPPSALRATLSGTAAARSSTVHSSGSTAPLPRDERNGDSRRLRSLGDVDRQFIDLDNASGWDEQAHDLRSVMQSTVPKLGYTTQPQQVTQPAGIRGTNSSLQPQTIGIHGNAVSTNNSGGAVDRGDSSSRQPVTVLRVESVPSQTYGVARTAAVLAADGKLTLLARPTGPSPERVRAALKLLRMAPESRDFEASAAEAAARAAIDDERVAAAVNQAAVAAVIAAVGTPGMEMEAQLRPPPASVDERDLQPGLILGQSEIDPAEVEAEPIFPLDLSWKEHHDHHDPHDPHVALPMMDVEGHMLGSQANMWHEDYDEVMGQIYDAQRSGWSEDAANGVFDSDVY